MLSCNVDTKDNTKEDSNEIKSAHHFVAINFIFAPLNKGHGLYKVKVDDTTTVLIYRGVESCTMIQLK